MSDLEFSITFLTPSEESFTGTALQIAAEIQVRTLKYGTCAYVVEPKMLFLWKIDGDKQ